VRKAIIFISLFCGLSALCFAKGSLELFVGAPLNWDKGTSDGHKAEVQTTSISLGFGFVSPIKDRFSWGFWDELIIPLKLDGTVDGERTTLGRDDYETLIGMSLFTGPVINLYSSTDGKVKIPLTIGIHWWWLAMSTKYTSIMGFQLGLGLGPGVEYHFNERVYTFGRVMGYYDFLSTNITTTATTYGTKTTSGSALVNSFGFTPNIGVGIVF
jgi:hypothetical protein